MQWATCSTSHQTYTSIPFPKHCQLCPQPICPLMSPPFMLTYASQQSNHIRALVHSLKCSEQCASLIIKLTPQFLSWNTQLPFPTFPSTNLSLISFLFMATHATQHSHNYIASLQIYLFSIKGFVPELLWLCWLCTLGSVNAQCQMQGSTCSSYHQTNTSIPFLKHSTTISNPSLNQSVLHLTSFDTHTQITTVKSLCCQWANRLNQSALHCMPTHVSPQSDHYIASLQTHLFPIKGCVPESLCGLCSSGSVSAQSEMYWATCFAYHQTDTSILMLKHSTTISNLFLISPPLSNHFVVSWQTHLVLIKCFAPELFCWLHTLGSVNAQCQMQGSTCSYHQIHTTIPFQKHSTTIYNVGLNQSVPHLTSYAHTCITTIQSIHC